MENKSIEEREKEFQTAWDMYWHQATSEKERKKYWDIMWERVYDACLNEAKLKCVGIRVPDLESKCMDATIKIMQVIGEGRRPAKLSSFVYLWTIGEIWSKKHIRWERAESFEETLAEYKKYAYIEEDDGFIICTSLYQ